jgi:arylsulfatase
VGVLPGKDGFPGKYAKDSTALALYNLRRDPGEHYDVKALYPQVVDDLMKTAENAREDLGDDLTGFEGKNRRPAGRIDK